MKQTFLALWLVVCAITSYSQECDSPIPLCYQALDNVVFDTTGTSTLMGDFACDGVAANGSMYEITTVAPGDLSLVVDGIDCDQGGVASGDSLVISVFSATDPCDPTTITSLECQTTDQSLTMSFVADSANQVFYVGIYGALDSGSGSLGNCGYNIQTIGEAVEIELEVNYDDTPIVLGQSVDVTVTGGESINWIGAADVNNTDADEGLFAVRPTDYGFVPLTIEATVGNCVVQQEIIIEVGPNILAATIITPNDDGINDYWNILYLEENFPLADVRVIDRWGQEVFKSIGYEESQRWDGTNGGKQLPAGAYYYVVNLNLEGNENVFMGAINLIY